MEITFATPKCFKNSQVSLIAANLPLSCSSLLHVRCNLVEVPKLEEVLFKIYSLLHTNDTYYRRHLILCISFIQIIHSSKLTTVPTRTGLLCLRIIRLVRRNANLKA
jgi:hypothetical protein